MINERLTEYSQGIHADKEIEMYTKLKNGDKSVRVICDHYGESIFLTWYQIRRARRALGMDMRKEMSEGIGDPRYEWVRNRRDWKGAIFRRAAGK